jgi:hypothetical protein
MAFQMVQSEAFHAHQSEHRLWRCFCSGQHKKWLFKNTDMLKENRIQMNMRLISLFRERGIALELFRKEILDTVFVNVNWVHCACAN